MVSDYQAGNKPLHNSGISSEMIKAARALLRWEQQDLARESDLSLAAIKRIERIRGNVHAQRRTIRAIIDAFERSGVKFDRLLDINARVARDVVTIDWNFKFYDELSDEEKKNLDLSDYESEQTRSYVDATAVFPVSKIKP